MMKKSTKGALAAAAAGSLLLGGAGSLAFWTDAATISGDSIASGHLSLVQSTTNCDATWMLDGVAYTTQVLSPGDELTRHCSYTVEKSGDNLSADLAVSAPGFDGTGDAALEGDMTVDGDFTYDADGAGTDSTADPVVAGAVTDIADGSVVDALITVSFNDVTNENNDSNTGSDLAATLDDTTVTITQS